MDITEKEAKKILSEIETELTGGRGLLRYTALDLVQFSKLWEIEKVKGTPIHKCISMYMPMMERRTAKQRLENLLNAFQLTEEE